MAISTGLGELIGGHAGAMAGTILKPAADLGLGLLENLRLDSMLKGKNPSMFIEDIKKQIAVKK